MKTMMYFADNQTKQRAFDRNYNAMAKSDFAQGRKLRALIEKEAVDDVLTDKLSKMYASSMSKGHEYEYDRVSGKLQKKVAAPTRQAQEAPSAPANSKPGKRTYVQENTDTGYETDAERPRESGYDAFINSPATSEFVNNLSGLFRKDGFKANKYSERDVKKNINNYINIYQKDARQGKFNAGREMNKRDKQKAKRDIFDTVMQNFAGKRDRHDSTDTSPNKRDVKKASTVKRNIFDELNDVWGDSDDDEKGNDGDDEEIKKEVAEEKRLKKTNPKVKKYYSKVIDEFVSKNKNGGIYYNQKDLYNVVGEKFATAVDERKGQSYFADNVPKPSGNMRTKAAFQTYKQELKGWLNGIFI